LKDIKRIIWANKLDIPLHRYAGRVACYSITYALFRMWPKPLGWGILSNEQWTEFGLPKSGMKEMTTYYAMVCS